MATRNNTTKNKITQTGRLGRLVLAMSAICLAAALPAGASAPSTSQHVDLSGVAAWAQTNGLSGLSPASAQTVTATPADLADWAIANGMTGLSPASLSPIGE